MTKKNLDINIFAHPVQAWKNKRLSNAFLKGTKRAAKLYHIIDH